LVSARILWSGAIEDRVDGILTGDQEVVRRLAAEVGAAVMKREVQRATSQPLPTLKAYSLLMGSITLMYRFSPDDFQEPRRMLDTLLSRGFRQPAPHAWVLRAVGVPD